MKQVPPSSSRWQPAQARFMFIAFAKKKKKDRETGEEEGFRLLYCLPSPEMQREKTSNAAAAAAAAEKYAKYRLNWWFAAVCFPFVCFDLC